MEMKNLFFLFAIVASFPETLPYDMGFEFDRGINVDDMRNHPRKMFRRNTSAPSDNILKEIDDEINHPQSHLAYCEFGGYLEYVSLQCHSETFLILKDGISDADKPPEIKFMALLASAIAVGCKETAIFLSKRLIQNYKEQKDDSQTCSASTIQGPKENRLIPCDDKTAELIREKFKSSRKLTLMYHVASSPLYLSLGCHRLGEVSVEDLSNDLHLIDTKGNDIKNIPKESLETFSKQKDALIMNYVNEHKSDILRTESLMQSVENTGFVDIDELATINDDNFDFVSMKTRPKRSTKNQNIEDRFRIEQGCSIASSLSVRIYFLSKSACLQFCFDDDNCRSAGYTNDNSKLCQLNTEIRKEVGAFFTCRQGESNKWDYFEKKRDIDYFIISSKLRGDVLTASSMTSVEMKPLNEDDSQLWFWQDDAIYSKKYNKKVLTINMEGSGKIVLDTNHNTKKQMWNFDNELFASQFGNYFVDIKDDTPEVAQKSSSLSQKWSLSLGRLYFIITSRHSGQVLEASNEKEQVSKGRVTIGSYHGNDTQLWFWDNDNIRSKSFPSKILDIRLDKWWKDAGYEVYLNTFTNKGQQRWHIEGDNIVTNSLFLQIINSNKKDNPLVYVNSVKSYRGQSLQQWTFGTYRTYFFIMNKNSGKVIDATSDSELKQWHYQGGKKSSQLWFWDRKVIRNKKYPDRVIDFNAEGGQYGNLLLNRFKGTQSQEWTYDDKTLLLVSTANNLSIAIPQKSESDGAVIKVVTMNKAQKWGINPEHDFFTVTARGDCRVMEASSTGGQIYSMSLKVGNDNQLWFWDGDNLRNKQLPQTMLTLDIKTYEWHKKYDHPKSYYNISLSLQPYNGGDHQKWKVEGSCIVSFVDDLHLEVMSSFLDNTQIRVNFKSYDKVQMWSQNAKERVYFTIKNAATDEYLCIVGRREVGLQKSITGEECAWFWDRDSIRPKKGWLVIKALDVNTSKKNKGLVTIQRLDVKMSKIPSNQKWKTDGKHFISKFNDLYLDASNSPSLYGKPRTQKKTQSWIMEQYVYRGTSTSCIDKTEEKIYNVVQWIPLVSTLWDLFSSIGYAAAGCKSVAQERAVSLAIGAVMDVTTIVTGGATAGMSTVVKTGIKVGIKYGLKQGLKATVKITQQSIKHIIKTTSKKFAEKITKSGIRKTIQQGFKRTGKLIIKEKFVEPARFLINAGKYSKQILTHPVKTLKLSWKSAADKIENLKQLKKKIDDIKHGEIKLPDGSIYEPKIRCKRSGLLGCLRLKRGYSKNQQSLYKEITNSDKLTGNVDVCANRFMAINEREYTKLPQHIKDKIDQLTTNTEKAQFFAAYKCKQNSWRVNVISEKILNGQPLQPNPQILKKFVDQTFDQIILIQNFLKKHPLHQPTTVYNWISDLLVGTGGVYTGGHLISATGISNRKGEKTDKKKFPIELIINLKRSGANLKEWYKYPVQYEWLIPIGTRFNMKVENSRRVVLTEII